MIDKEKGKKMKMKQKRLEQGLLVGIIILMFALIISYGKQEKVFLRQNTDSDVRYVKAEVEEILEQEVTASGENKEYVLGYQKLAVSILEGEQKGKSW